MSKRKQATAPTQTEPPYFDEKGYFRFRPVSSDARHAQTLSPFSPELVTWFERFESSCVLDCCGLSALSFKWPTEWDKRWNYNSQIMKLLEALHDEVLQAKSDVLKVLEFQQTIYKDDLLFFIDYLQGGMKKSIQLK